MFYSKSTGGFYVEEIHGSRKVTVVDPEATPDTIEIDNPDCKIPADAVEITPEQHAALLNGQSSGKCIVADADGYPILQDPPPPTPEQIIAGFTVAVQQRLDDFARTRGYDGILSAATYATSTVPTFAAEGQYAVQIRDATWAKCYEILAAVEAGTKPVPTLDELTAELPVMTWPR